MENETNQQEIGEGFSSVDLIYQCLIDEDKFTAFNKVLRGHVNSESRALDLGTGSGILAMLMARLGAKKVTAVEFDPFVADIARSNIKENNLDAIVEVLTDDARTIKFQGKEEGQFDIIVMEMLATGLIDEMQVQAINNLIDQNLIREETVVIPHAQENFMSLAQTNFTHHGFSMKMISHLWSHDDNEDMFTPLSSPVLINSINFSKRNPESFSKEIAITASTDGEVNSVCLSSNILVDREGEVTLGSTSSLSPFVIVPLTSKRVSKGDVIAVSVAYNFGGGFKNFTAKIVGQD